MVGWLHLKPPLQVASMHLWEDVVCAEAHIAYMAERKHLVLMVSEGLAVATPGFRFDRYVVFKTTHRVEDGKVADAQGFPGPFTQDGEYHGCVGFGGSVLGL